MCLICIRGRLDLFVLHADHLQNENNTKIKKTREIQDIFIKMNEIKHALGVIYHDFIDLARRTASDKDVFSIKKHPQYD